MDDLEGSDSFEKQRLEEVERKLQQQASAPQKATTVQQSKTSKYSLDDDNSVASEDIDEMSMSVGQEHESDSENSDLYSFLKDDKKPSSSSANSKATVSQQNNNPLSSSGDFSVSEQEIDALSTSGYFYTTNALAPDAPNH